MTTFRCFILAALCATLAGAAQAADAATHPAYTLPNSEVRDLPRNAAGRQYQLYIGLPGDYAKNPDQHYPVVYVTDGYWDFQKIFALQGTLVWDQEAPSYITVGIGYVGTDLDYGSMRRWELSPVAYGAHGPEKSGHAADFLHALATEIIPFVQREYRADPSHRVLAGASLGGLFTLFAMYTQPELFESYVALTPAVVIGNDWLLGYEDTFAKAGRPLNGRLFVSGGADETPSYLAGILRYNQRVQSRAHAGLAYQFRLIDGERHATAQFDGYARGLLFAFAPLAAEHGPAAER